MADNSLSFQPYQLPSTATNIPSEYGQDYFNTLQGTLGLNQQNQANNLLGFQQSHGLASPQDTNTGLLSQVLGSPQQQINSQIIPQAMNASSLGQGQQYQTQMQALQFQQQLEQMKQAQDEQTQLLVLAQQLYPHGYKQSFGQSLGSVLASSIGSVGTAVAANGLSDLLFA